MSERMRGPALGRARLSSPAGGAPGDVSGERHDASGVRLVALCNLRPLEGFEFPRRDDQPLLRRVYLRHVLCPRLCQRRRKTPAATA